MKAVLTSLVIVMSALFLIIVGVDEVLADSLQNGATKQRIGNYDVEMTTDPKSPVAGGSTSILIQISGVNGDHLVDVPATVRIIKDGTEIHQTNPIIVPFGHYSHQFTFEQGGRYTVYLDINDYMYSGEILTFTFFISVAGMLDYYLFVVAPIGVVIVFAMVILFAFVRKKRNSKKQTAEQS